MGKRSRHVRATLSVLLLSAAAFFGLAATASALPGDPPIDPVGPGEGATVNAVEEGLKVTYTCPIYRTGEEAVEEEVENEEEEIEVVESSVPVFETSEGYGVVFSTNPGIGKDGRLASTGFGEAGEAEAEAVKGTPWCSSELELPTSPNPAALYHGKVYWQAFRECEECALGFETGPVRSFVVVPYFEEAEINYENHVYGGYLTKVTFFASASLKGAKVGLQRWTGTEWITIAEEPGTEAAENSFFVTLGAGHRLLRPILLGTGVVLPLEEKAKTVRKATKGPRLPVQAGKWAYALKKEREEFPLTFRVTDGGTMVRGLSAAMEGVCKGPTPAQNVKIEPTTGVRAVKISPDGSVVAHFLTAGATPTTVTFTGSFFGGRFTGLITSSFLGNCSGFREFEAVPEATGSR
jgi:hypothetical protein